MTKTIKGLLLSAAGIFAAGLFLLIYLSLATVHERSVREDAIRTASTLANMTYSSMFALMSTGWERSQLLDFADSLDVALADGPSRIQIYRGKRVDELFGPIEQPLADDAIQEVVRSGQIHEELRENEVRFVFPLRAAAVCLGCHINAVPGEALGAIDVKQSVGAVIAESRRRFALIFLLAIPFTLLAAWLMVRYIDRRLSTSIDSLDHEIAAINRMSDLRTLVNRPLQLGFTEFDRIGCEIGRLTERLRSVAVDREIMELEIRLLEKLVLSSEIVHDWQAYAKKLVIDINELLPLFALFSMFRLDDQTIELHVFWLSGPSAPLKAGLDACLRTRMACAPVLNSSTVCSITHHAPSSAVELNDLTEDVLHGHTKVLMSDVQKIGGIVGVGVLADTQDDPSNLLAIESVLAALMSAVGSVKAVHHYTEQLEHHAARDPLTRLFNQRLFWELLDNEMARAIRHDKSLALLVIDVDDFKLTNDCHGHACGDSYLQGVARMIEEAVRGCDIVARYGGDEFVAILPGAAMSEGIQVASRILDFAAKLGATDPTGAPLSCSLSIGLAVFPEQASDQKELFLLADNMMYRAKAEGKNRAVALTEEYVPMRRPQDDGQQMQALSNMPCDPIRL